MGIETKTEYRVKLGKQWVQTWHGPIGGVFGEPINEAKIFSSEAKALEVAEHLDGIVTAHTTTYEEIDLTPDDDHAPSPRVWKPEEQSPGDITPPSAEPNANLRENEK